MNAERILSEEQIKQFHRDAAFFDSYAPHRSHPNHTGKARRVLYITYNKASEGDSRQQYYADKRRNYPPDIEREPGNNYSFKV